MFCDQEEFILDPKIVYSVIGFLQIQTHTPLLNFRSLSVPPLFPVVAFCVVSHLLLTHYYHCELAPGNALP